MFFLKNCICLPAIEPYLFVCLFVCIVKQAFWFVSSWSSSLMLFPHAGAQEFAVHGLVYKGGKYNAHRERRRGASYAVFCIASTNPCASSSTPAWVSPSPLCSLKRVLVCWPSCHGMFSGFWLSWYTWVSCCVPVCDSFLLIVWFLDLSQCPWHLHPTARSVFLVSSNQKNCVFLPLHWALTH